MTSEAKPLKRPVLAWHWLAWHWLSGDGIEGLP